MSPIPELPGVLVPRHSEQERWMRAHVARICQLDHERFPGSQPVSFSIKDLAKLKEQDFWVCEKSDGIRVLLLIIFDPEADAQAVYLIDRHNTYREITGFCFPHHEDPRNVLKNTVIDGELVLDVDPATKKETLRFLAFDCLVIDDQNVMSRTLDRRYGRLQQWWYKPYSQMLRDHPKMAEAQPFSVRVKEINFSYHVEQVFNFDIPNLQHGSDGLIYTCVSTPYTPGTDPNILKWKPPSENSIDFKLVLRFPPLPSNPSQPNFFARPHFQLHVWCGDERGVPKYEYWDEMDVDDDEWESLKLSGEQIDDRIVEVHWDPSIDGWRMMRFRDDKPNGNHKSVVDNIVQSIMDGVEKDSLLARSIAIRDAWKARQAQSAAPGPPMRPQPGPPMRPQPGPPLRPPPIQQQHQPPAMANGRLPPPPNVEIRYGPLAPSPWSKVSGPPVFAGMKR